jgi:uncharacterized membrane protein
MHISKRLWVVLGLVLAVGILLILAAIVGRGAPTGEYTQLAQGESEILRARVVEVLEEGVLDQGEVSQPYQVLRLEISSGSLAGQGVIVEHGYLVFTNESRLFREGDRVLVERTGTMEGEDIFHVTDYVRTTPLLWLTVLFIVATLLLSGWQGLRSLLGMGVSLAVILLFIVPQILAGRNPLVIAILGSVVMMGLSLYLVYGWNSKTHVARCVVGELDASLWIWGRGSEFLAGSRRAA